MTVIDSDHDTAYRERKKKNKDSAKWRPKRKEFDWKERMSLRQKKTKEERGKKKEDAAQPSFLSTNALAYLQMRIWKSRLTKEYENMVYLLTGFKMCVVSSLSRHLNISLHENSHDATR